MLRGPSAKVVAALMALALLGSACSSRDDDDASTESGGEDVGIAADMDPESRHESGAPSARESLRRRVEKSRARKIGEVGGGRREGEENVEAWHHSTLSTKTRILPPHERPTFQAVSSATPNSRIRGFPSPITSIASVITAPSTHPPET